MGKLIAEYSNSTPSSVPDIKYVATDHIGSPRAITDKFGAVLSRRDFLPFGEELFADGSIRTTGNKYSVSSDGSIRRGFTTYAKDPETGLDFAEARYYNKQFGRFTSVDPLLSSGKASNPQSFNRYSYVVNNPIEHTDSSGLQMGSYTGTIYFNPNGPNGGPAFGSAGYARANPQLGLKPYEGRPIEVVASDGYRYRLESNRSTMLGKESLRSEGGLNSGGLGLIQNMGARAPALLNITTVAAIPMIVVVVPAIAGAATAGGATAIGTPSAATIIGAFQAIGAAEIILLSESTACGGEGPCGEKLPDQLSKELADIYTRYPACSYNCDLAAQETLEAFERAGIEAELVPLTSGTNYIHLNDGSKDGLMISSNGTHYAVRSNGLYYDAVTGATGATWEDYVRSFMYPIYQRPPTP